MLYLKVSYFLDYSVTYKVLIKYNIILKIPRKLSLRIGSKEAKL